VSQYPQDPLDPTTDRPRDDDYESVDPVVDDAVASEAEPYTGGATAVEGDVVVTTTTYPTETYTSDAESSRTGQVADQGRQVAGTAADQARNVAGTAKEQAGNVAQEAKSQARNLVSEARGTLKGQAESQTQRAGQAAHGVAESLQALTEGRMDEAGPFGDYAQQAAEQVRRFAERIDRQGFDGLLDDVQRFARRQPVTFLIGAAVAGFAVGRVARGARDAGQGSNGGYDYGSGGYRSGGYDRTDYGTTPGYPSRTDYGTAGTAYDEPITGVSTAVGSGSGGVGAAESSLPVAGVEDRIDDADLYDDGRGDTR
jgi:uncharacterized protein YjbJ (UPF0337 family)